MKEYKMRVFLFLIIAILSASPAFATKINGYAEKQGTTMKVHKVVDAADGRPVSTAKIQLPGKNYVTTTGEDGSFHLQADINAPTIMSVEKEGYKPFSLTMDKYAMSKPIIIGIEKSTPADIVIEQDLLHLGDNNFSDTSANASEFRAFSKGPIYKKNFNIPPVTLAKNAYLVIGSVIGIDTKMAIDLGQSNVQTTYSSPPEIFLNNNKIADLKINGDHQEIKLPANLIKSNQPNEIMIRTGQNLFQNSYVDYDDIELMNLTVEVY